MCAMGYCKIGAARACEQNGRCPGQLHRASARPYTGLGELKYSLHDRTITVPQCGRICIGRRKINLSSRLILMT